MTPDAGALRDASDARNAAAIVAAQAAEEYLQAIVTGTPLGAQYRQMKGAVINWRQAQDRYNALADAVDLQAGVIR